MQAFNKVAAQSLVDVEKAFARIAGRPPSTQGLNDVWLGAGMVYANELLGHWDKSLREKLLPFAYAELPS